MKQTTRLFTVISIVCLFGLLICGTAAAAHDTANHTYDINLNNITILKNDSSNSLDIIEPAGVGGEQKIAENIPLNTEITIIGNSETTNVININGYGLPADTQITVRIKDVNINGSAQGRAAISLVGGANVKLILDGEKNVLKSGTDSTAIAGQEGLEVPEDCRIEIIQSQPNQNENQTDPEKDPAVPGFGIIFSIAAVAGLIGIGAYQKRKNNK
jgi:Uncharacterized protein conserved in archaea